LTWEDNNNTNNNDLGGQVGVIVDNDNMKERRLLTLGAPTLEWENISQVEQANTKREKKRKRDATRNRTCGPAKLRSRVAHIGEC
jgi:hypothetical protein